MTDEQRAALARLRGINTIGIGSDWQDWLESKLGSDVRPNVIADVITAVELALAEGRAVEHSRRLKPVAMPIFTSEKDFQAAVIKLAETHGWRVYHAYLSLKSNPGYPDLTMVRGRSIVLAELKVEPNNPTKAQEEWLAAFKNTDADTYCWYPSNWPEIVARLGSGIQCTGND